MEGHGKQACRARIRKWIGSFTFIRSGDGEGGGGGGDYLYSICQEKDWEYGNKLPSTPSRPAELLLYRQINTLAALPSSMVEHLGRA
jgi:hypothetical protein